MQRWRVVKTQLTEIPEGAGPWTGWVDVMTVSDAEAYAEEKAKGADEKATRRAAEWERHQILTMLSEKRKTFGDQSAWGRGWCEAWDAAVVCIRARGAAPKPKLEKLELESKLSVDTSFYAGAQVISKINEIIDAIHELQDLRDRKE